METTSGVLLAFGSILLVGLATSAIGRHTFLPRVTLLLIFGVIIGQDVLNLVPAVVVGQFELIANVSLLMVGFLLGGKMTTHSIEGSISKVMWISISAAIVTTLIVIISLVAVGIQLEIAILLGCIASATAPAAILDVVMESECPGKFKDILLSIVALDDAWALILFALGISAVQAINGDGADLSTLTHALRDIGGAVLLGVVLGPPAAFLTGRLKPGKPILLEAIGLVFVCGGLAMHFEVSYLIAAMVMGAVVANFARHHSYPFHAIENVESIFLVIFFVLAGASLELASLMELSMLGVVYIIARAAGKILGASVGGHISRADAKTKTWMGWALLPQAGVAIGMALVASSMFPEYRQTLLTIVISSTIFFEIIGPIFTRLAVERVTDRTPVDDTQ